jgi:hypothetical protein
MEHFFVEIHIYIERENGSAEACVSMDINES